MEYTESKKLGKFIVFEGIDGSGKSTQLKLLRDRLEEDGYKTAVIDFPQYGKKSAGLVEEYLSGKYGKSQEVTPYQGSVFYACDRFDASFQIRDWLKQGRIVISDRYIGSNIGHQGGKIDDKDKWKEYLDWLLHLEYDIFNIPKPDLTFVLKTNPSLSQKLTLSQASSEDDKEKSKKRAYLGKDKKDIHDKDLSHLINAERSYLRWAEEDKGLILIDCIDGQTLLSPAIIHEKVWDYLKKILG